jgi:hypothetical protein
LDHREAYRDTVLDKGLPLIYETLFFHRLLKIYHNGSQI